MPADRRKLRQQLTEKRKRVVRTVGFDFDCTLTVKHFFKVFTWGYAQGNRRGHAHCEALWDWCEKNGVDIDDHTPVQPDVNPISAALDVFIRNESEDTFRKLFREVFLGGEERIKAITKWLQSMSEAGVEFCILTAGIASSVLQALTAVPEWLKFFPCSRIWDSSQSRHSVRSTMATKVLTLADIVPESVKTILIDDSLEHDTPPSWVLKGANVEVVGLEYEGSGVDLPFLEDIRKRLLGDNQ